MRRCAAALSRSPELRLQRLAVGDGENDVSMIRMAGVGVAMDNALDLVKQYADEITLTNDEDGVAAVIERLIG